MNNSELWQNNQDTSSRYTLFVMISLSVSLEDESISNDIWCTFMMLTPPAGA